MSLFKETSTPLGALYTLVVDLFEPDEFRRWLRLGPDADIVPELPGELAGEAVLVDNALEALRRRGKIDEAFFARLTTARPRRSDAIAAVAALWGVPERAPQDPGSGDATPPRRPPDFGSVLWEPVELPLSAITGAPGAGRELSSEEVSGASICTFTEVERPPPTAIGHLPPPTPATAAAAGSRAPGRMLLFIGSGVLSAGLVSYGLFGGSADKGPDGAGTNAGPPAAPKPEVGQPPLSTPPTCERDDEKLAGTTCVARCPDGMRFIKGTGGYVFPREGGPPGIADFCLDTTEVSVAAFRSHAGTVSYERGKSLLRLGGKRSEPSRGDKYCNGRREDREDHPINCVDWQQAFAHCQSIGGRLPTEWEWEWAARGRDEERVYPWGSEKPDCTRAIFSPDSVDGCGEDRTWAVGSVKGSLSDSRDGVQDMSGNVWEWTLNTDNKELANDGLSDLRGGSWLDDEAGNARSTIRGRFGPVSHYGVGFRCARAAL